MAYTVLARKYRSKSFDDVVGQQPIAQTLKNAIEKDRVAHAYLFVGTRGIGKTTMARILAKALNCQSADQPTTEPCCKCDSCKAINKGDDIDVIEIDGASNNGVEQVRELRQNAIYRPVRSRFKIYIIDEVHMLSTAAFNALLKTLEEPPEHVKFIFATTEPNKVIPTIQSRCQRYDFNNISPTKIAEHLKYVLKEEKIDYNDEFVIQVAKLANGSMRDGLSILDRLISTGAEKLTAELLEEFMGLASAEKIHNLIGAIGKNESASALEMTGDLISQGLSEEQIADSMINSFRDILVAKTGGLDSDVLILTAQQKESLNKIKDLFDEAGLIYNISTLEKLRWTLKNSETARALLDATVLRFTLSEHFLNLDELAKSLQNANPAGLKKKLDRKTPPSTSEKNSRKISEEKQLNIPSLKIKDLEQLKQNWDDLMDFISDSFNASLKALIEKGAPKKFDGKILTVAFGQKNKINKKMLETGDRTKKLEKFFSGQFSQPIRLTFTVEKSTDNTETEKKTEENKKDEGKLRKKILNDQGVKTVLKALDAKITDIDLDNG